MMRKLIFASLFLTVIIHTFGQTQQSDSGNWRIRFSDRNVAETLYRITPGPQTESNPQEFLNTHSRLLGIDRAETLRLIKQVHTSIGAHYFYQQYSRELPIEGAGVSIHVDHSNRVVAVNSSIQPGLAHKEVTIVSSELARPAVQRVLGAAARTSRATLVALPLAGQAIPAWRIHVDSTNHFPASFSIYVDSARPNVILRMLKTVASSTGEGLVYGENPVVTPDRVKQPFLYLQGEKLHGKYVKTLNANGRRDVNEFRFSDFTTASNPNLNFHFGER